MADDPYVEELRAQIGEIDRMIVEAVNTRLQLVRRLRAHKEEHGMTFLDTRQERKILRELARADLGSLI